MTYKCYKCGKEFKTIYALAGHIRMAHSTPKRKKRTNAELFIELLKLYAFDNTMQPKMTADELATKLNVSPTRLKTLIKWIEKNGLMDIIKLVWKGKHALKS